MEELEKLQEYSSKNLDGTTENTYLEVLVLTRTYFHFITSSISSA